MSCCGGNCGCGANCKCGNGCGGCNMYPEVDRAPTETVVLGVAPQKTTFEESETVMGAAENGCKCNPCNCNPCNCK